MQKKYIVTNQENYLKVCKKLKEGGTIKNQLLNINLVNSVMIRNIMLN